MKSKYLIIALIYLVIHLTYTIVLLDDQDLRWWCREDGPIEYIGAVSFVLTSGLFFLAYKKSSYSKGDATFFGRHRNLFYLALGVLFLVCFLEEISWGQRLFGLETPEALKEINAQNEINFHNLWLFQDANINPDGTEKSALVPTLNMNRLFCIFWALFCVVIPVAGKISSRARGFWDYIRMPMTPLWIGALFVTHAVVFEVIYNAPTQTPEWILVRLNELKETNYALIFLLLAGCELRATYRHGKREGHGAA